MKPTREVISDGWRIRLDLSRQFLRLEVPEEIIDHVRRGPPLSHLLPLTEGGPVSAATLLLKAKLFDDRLYAAVELAAQQGAGRFAGKATLLRSLATTLAGGLPDTGNGAAGAMHVACELGGLGVPIPETIAESVRTARDDFLGNEILAKPLGFYTWSPELSMIFRQDRFLQQPLDPATADDLADALRKTPGAMDAYEDCLRLNARLTNPAKKPNVRDAGKRLPFFPPSRSHEVTLFEKLYEDRPIPEGFDLMAELIRRVRSGHIRLAPADDAGWYDYQTWSLEPLIVPDRMPERTRLEMGKRYRKHLEDLFRGAMALTRETHVKQGGGGYGGGSIQQPIWVNPELTVEPLPTLYARRAACYRFVRSVLEEAFGADALIQMKRAPHAGAAMTGLAEELAWIEELFTGAAVTADRELGMPPRECEDAPARCFSAWRASVQTDRDVSQDARMMAPVFFDELRKRTKVWAFLGWRTITVTAEYRVPPAILAVKSSGPLREPPPVRFCGNRYDFSVPVMAEVYVARLLDRTEFRQHCDRYKTRDAILANLDRG